MGRFDALTKLDKKPLQTTPSPDIPQSPAQASLRAEKTPSHQSTEQSNSQGIISSNRENKKASMQSSKQDSLQASTLASMLAIQPEIIEIIRKVVKTPAKEEVLYVRI